MKSQSGRTGRAPAADSRTAGTGSAAATAERQPAGEPLSEECFAEIFHASPIAMTIATMEAHRLIDVNDSFLELFGYRRDEVIGRTTRELKLTVDIDQRVELMHRAVAGESIRNVEAQYRRKSGETGYALFSGEMLQLRDESVWVTMRVDITERKRSEAMLELQSAAAVAIAEAADFRAALEKVLQLTCDLTGWQLGEAWLPTPDGNWLEWSGACYSTISGIDEFITVSRQSRLARGRRFIGTAWARGQPAWLQGEFAADARGRLIPGGLMAHCAIPAIARGQVVAVLSFFAQQRRPHDQRLLDGIAGIALQLAMLFGHKRIEEALKKSEERFALFMHHMPGAVFIKDAQGRYVYANPVSEEAKRVGPGEWRGKTDAELFSPESARQFKLNDHRVYQTGTAIESIEEAIWDDAASYWLTSKFLIPGNPGSPALLAGVGLNITELKRTEAALRESERLLTDALQERNHLYRDLHDHIVQAIYAVGMNLEECQRLTADTPRLAMPLLQRAIGDLNNVIAQVRRYISGPQQQAQALGAAKFRSELAKLAGTRRADATVPFRVRVEAAAVARLTGGDAEQVLNVAREALSNSLRHSRARDGKVTLQLVEESVCLRVSDDGVGFDVQAQRRPNGGLHNMHYRARQLGAEIDICSAPGHGTRVEMRMPKARRFDGVP